MPLYVNASACEIQGSTCPPPADQTWHVYDAWENANGADTKSFLMPPKDWDADYAALLNMTGAGGYFVDQIVLQNDGDLNSQAHLENQVLAVSKDWTVNLGVEMQYTRSVSLVSAPAAMFVFGCSNAVLTIPAFFERECQQYHILQDKRRNRQGEHQLVQRL